MYLPQEQKNEHPGSGTLASKGGWGLAVGGPWGVGRLDWCLQHKSKNTHVCFVRNGAESTVFQIDAFLKVLPLG